MTDRKRHRSMVLAEYAELLFGPQWVAPVSRLTGLEMRQVSRIKAAAVAGRSHPVAQEALTALHREVSAIARSMRPLTTPERLRETEKRYARRGQGGSRGRLRALLG